jgi:hypothetical protein
MKGVRDLKLRGASKRQTAILQARAALEAGQKFAFINISENDKGIYRVQWKGRARNGQRRIKMRMVYDMSQRQIVTKPRPWLRPAMESTTRKGQKIFTTMARQELARRKLIR